MRVYRIGMRWWLGALFVLIACLTAVLLAVVSSRQTERALESNSEAIAIGKTVAAGFSVEAAIRSGSLQKAIEQSAQRRGLALFVFSAGGRPISPRVSHGISWNAIPDRAAALASALGGHRFAETSSGTRATLVALPLRRTRTARALVSYAPRPSVYGTSIAILHREIVRAALWAVLASALVGLLASALIARRLARIGKAARAIEKGSFDVRLEPRLRDEVGTLAQAIDRMRRHLRESFERLRAERDRLERLLEQLQEGVLAVDRSLRVQVANTKARALLGLADEAAVELPERFGDLRLRGLATGLFRPDAVIAEARVETGDGKTVAIAGVPAGRSDLAVIVLTDTTEHERRERAEREFVANASHELRTPVSAIISAIEALKHGAKEAPPVERDAFLDIIERQAVRLARLTRSLLVMARAQSREEPIHLDSIELRPLLDEIVGSSPPRSAVTLSVECPERLYGLGHRDLTEQILSNLVENALKHTAKGAVTLTAAPRGTSVVIEVADTGGGISPEARSRIFDRFYSGGGGQRAGFGLGLAIARDAVRAQGGRLEIQSEPGHGTTARVILTRFVGNGA